MQPDNIPYNPSNQFDPDFDRSLRPPNLEEFFGQKELVERLKISIKAAKMRKEPLGHSLFHGPPGLGKTSLSHIVAKEMGGDLIVSSGPAISKAGDLAGILTSLKEGDLLFIDEIHRLSRVVEEYLYPAIEDFSIDLMLDSGPSARSVKIQLSRFTLIGATTRIGDLSAPLRSRFTALYRLEPYDLVSMRYILKRSSKKLGIELSDPCFDLVAKRCRSIPRLGNHWLRWIRDVYQAQGYPNMELEDVEKALEMAGIDEYGLTPSDRRLLEILWKQYPKPIGLSTLAVLLDETVKTIEEILETPLLSLGFIDRSPRGRQLTNAGIRYLENSKKKASL